MRNNYHFECGESDGKVYHSEKHRDAAACKAAAKQYCEDHKQDVKLYSILGRIPSRLSEAKVGDECRLFFTQIIDNQ